MWSDTRSLVLMAMTAALYAGTMMPLKGLQIVPGLTEIRPAAAVPVTFGVLFGAPACWGAALGNLVGDLLGGMFGLGSLFGFVANWLLALVPWRASAMLGMRPHRPRLADYLLLPLVGVLGASACALTAGWGVDLLGIFPYAFLANVIFLNNVLVTALLGPPLLAILGPRVRRFGLEARRGENYRGLRKVAGLALITAGSLGGYLALNVLATGGLHMLGPEGAVGTPALPVTGAVALLVLLLGCLL